MYNEQQKCVQKCVRISIALLIALNRKKTQISIYTAAAKSLQSCPTLCDPIDGSLPGSSVPGILQVRTLEWVAISFSNARKWKVKVKSLQSCPTLSDPMDCSLPGSSVHGIFQARVLEWGAIAFSHPSILVLGNSSALSFLYSPILTSIHDHWKNHSLDLTNLCWQSNVSAF